MSFVEFMWNFYRRKIIVSSPSHNLICGLVQISEMFFPSNNIRFVSINDQFDTINGITNRNKSAYIQSSTRVPLINLFNEQVSIETKMKVEVVLDMKAQHGEFIGPRAPFGYQKSNENPSQLVPDPVAAVIVRKIFEMAASGAGVTGIVRYLNERGLPTPIQYAKAHGIDGNFDDGNGSWNSRSVKYILTNRTYTGMLVQGKEKRVVEATHEPLVDSGTFDAIQKAFQSRAYNVVPQGQSADNILKGKVICGCAVTKCSASAVPAMLIGTFSPVLPKIVWALINVPGCMPERKMFSAPSIAS